MYWIEVFKDFGQLFDCKDVRRLAWLILFLYKTDVELISVGYKNRLPLSEKLCCEHAKHSNTFNQLKKIKLIGKLDLCFLILFISFTTAGDKVSLTTGANLPAGKNVD